MFITVPAPIRLIDIETGKVLTARDVIDGATGKSYEELNREFKNDPIAMRAFFAKHLLSLFDTPADSRAARRIMRKLAEAEEMRAGGDDSPVVDLGADGEVLKRKLDAGAFKMNGIFLVQYADFFDAIEDMRRERPKQVLKAVEPEAG